MRSDHRAARRAHSGGERGILFTLVQDLRTVEGAAGLVFALFLLSGRWSPMRLYETDEPAKFLEARFWIAIALVILLLLPTYRAPAPGARIRGREFLLPVLMFLVYMVFTIWWAPDLAVAREKAYEILLICVACVTLFRWLVVGNASRVRDALWRWIVRLTLVIGGLAILEVSGTREAVRLSVLAGGPNTFGRMMGLLCLGALFMWRRRGKPHFWIPIAVVAGLLVVVSGSRGAMIALVTASLCYALVEKLGLTRRVALTVMVIVVALLLLHYTPVGQSAKYMFEERVSDLTLERYYDSGRTNLFMGALDLGRAHPIFGAGLGSFSVLMSARYPHNILLEAFSEGGLVGVALFILILGVLLVSIFRNAGELHATSLAAFALALVFSQFSGDLYDNRLVFLFMMLALVRTPRGAEGGRVSAPRTVMPSDA